MLEELYIDNFVLIDDMHLQFSAGINVMSGETGAGKSIIIDALGVLLGDRINNDFVKDNQRRALVEGVFDVSGNDEALLFLCQQGLKEDGDDQGRIILSREIHPGGRSTARINGRQVTVAALKSLAAGLVDIHLQDDRQNIMKPVYYLDYIDGFAGPIDNLLQQVASDFKLLQEQQVRLQKLQEGIQNRSQRLDYLDFQIREIESAGLHESEEEELTIKRDRIKNAAKLLKTSNRLLELLYDGGDGNSAHDQVGAGLDEVMQLKSDGFLAALAEPLENIYYSLQDIASRVAEFRGSLEFEPGELEEIENRLYLISRFKGKYGSGVAEILAYLETARQEKELLLASEDRLEQSRLEMERIRADYLQKSEELSQRRSQAAAVLAARVHQELTDLNMPHICFEVRLSRREVPSSKGMDAVDFWFSPNPGEEMKPVTKIASGGEISRFILALKTALADVYNIPTLIFDEIDAGLGGEALNSVARKLGQLTRNRQLILVTHSPQVASLGDRNLMVEKTVAGGKTHTRVKHLDADEKVVEIARMLAGDSYSQLTMEHAREMIASAKSQKPSS